MVIPGTDRLVGGGKTGILYLLDRGTMTEAQEFHALINAFDPTAAVDANWVHRPHMLGWPSWWKGCRSQVLLRLSLGGEGPPQGPQYVWATGQLDTLNPTVGNVVALTDTMPAGRRRSPRTAASPIDASFWDGTVGFGPFACLRCGNPRASAIRDAFIRCRYRSRPSPSCRRRR
jgi:hypothetical protein